MSLFKIVTSLVILGGAYLLEANAAESELDIDPVHFKMHKLMAETTFFIHGAKKDLAGQECGGTVFVLVHPFEDQDISKSGWKGNAVLVTAAHVLNDIGGDKAKFDGRVKLPDGTWKKQTIQLKIRDGSKNLYVQHPKQDVAVMWMTDGIEIGEEKLIWTDFALPTFLLANDDVFEKCNLNIGSSLSCLGFPLGIAANSAGFPILRNGAIASYPILPSKNYPTFHFDFEVYAGNSGGPVYYFEPGFDTGPGTVTMKKNCVKNNCGPGFSTSWSIAIDRIRTVDWKSNHRTHLCKAWSNCFLPDYKRDAKAVAKTPVISV